ncbi:MAG: hypothetical protein JJE51_10325 [Thermoanaerobaculia bacterium]|nr:hypothetical protein [Thermoanaerobaculia bacterium]
MPRDSELLSTYVEHLSARLRARENRPTADDKEQGLAVLPSELATLCSESPRECLNFVIRALEHVTDPQLVRAIADELLQNLLNEKSAVIHVDIAKHLRTNRRFRQAFACGNYASVDPALIDDWAKVFQELGTTKQAERKALFKAPTVKGD